MLHHVFIPLLAVRACGLPAFAGLQERAAELLRRRDALAQATRAREAEAAGLRQNIRDLQEFQRVIPPHHGRISDEELKARTKRNLQLRAELKATNERASGLRAEALLSGASSSQKTIDKHLQETNSRIAALWSQNRQLQKEELAIRSRLEDLRAAEDVERGGLESNRSELAAAVKRQDEATATLKKNVTGLRAETASLIRQRGELQGELAAIGPRRHQLALEEARVSELRGENEKIAARLTKVRASLLFGDALKLRRDIAADVKRNRALWQQRSQLERRSLEDKAAVQAAERYAAKISEPARRARAGLAALKRRARRFRMAETGLKARGQKLRHAAAGLKAALHRGEVERAELARELSDLGTAS